MKVKFTSLEDWIDSWKYGIFNITSVQIIYFEENKIEDLSNYILNQEKQYKSKKNLFIEIHVSRIPTIILI